MHHAGTPPPKLSRFHGARAPGGRQVSGGSAGVEVSKDEFELYIYIFIKNRGLPILPVDTTVVQKHFFSVNQLSDPVNNYFSSKPIILFINLAKYCEPQE